MHELLRYTEKNATVVSSADSKHESSSSRRNKFVCSVPKHPAAAFPFTGEFSPNFDLTNMISTYTKNFLKKKTHKFARF
jgi:hypothetical protein